jgi:hypothetical protein
MDLEGLVAGYSDRWSSVRSTLVLVLAGTIPCFVPVLSELRKVMKG